MSLFEQILAARGLTGDSAADFLSPDYDKKHDPFLLPDMGKATKRLTEARKKQEHITIYGDYDIDGLTATALLIDALNSFGFKHVDAFIPNRFEQGYGLTVDAMESIAAKGTTLCITVDCGSLSYEPITRAKELGMEVIVTDHHTMGEKLPPAVAVINPKREDHKYPFIDLAGVGVAFKLVQALQTKLDGLPVGAEKWLLDLVALGTVCDVVTLLDENRTNVYFGLQVMSKTRRPGLRALMSVAKVDSSKLNTRILGFALGPRMNAAGRLETAQHALDMLLASDSKLALEKAQVLDEMNIARRTDQAKILKEAIVQAEKYKDNPVLVVSHPDWNHGIVGIVAAKLLEKYKKPAYVLQEMGEITKGSARSFGDFSAVDAINHARDLLISGGGHKLAAGVSLKTSDIDTFRQKINKYYKSLGLKNQADLLLQKQDAEASLSEVTVELVNELSRLEPFGHGNPEPILKTSGLIVENVRTMGDKNQHLKIRVRGTEGPVIEMLAFSAPEEFFVDKGSIVDVLYMPMINEWNGRVSLEGRLINLKFFSVP